MKLNAIHIIMSWSVLGALLIPYSFIFYIVNIMGYEIVALYLYMLFIPAFFTLLWLFIWLDETLIKLWNASSRTGTQGLILMIATLLVLSGFAILPFSYMLVLLYSFCVMPLWIAPIVYWQLRQEKAKPEKAKNSL
jgi:hypothetical protein